MIGRTSRLFENSRKLNFLALRSKFPQKYFHPAGSDRRKKLGPPQFRRIPTSTLRLDLHLQYPTRCRPFKSIRSYFVLLRILLGGVFGGESLSVIGLISLVPTAVQLPLASTLCRYRGPEAIRFT